MAATLPHRERVLRALDGGDIDRVPMTFRAEEDLTARLAEALGTRELDEYFDCDTIQIFLKYHDYELPDLKAMYRVEDVDAAAWPGAGVLDLERSVREIQAARASGRAVMTGAWASLFTNSRRVMGEERYLIEMYSNPEFIARIVERMADHYLAINERLFSACARDIDIFYFGSDLGTQTSMFVSPELCRQFFVPQMKRLVEQAKGYGLKVMYHTCGAVWPIISDLAGIGIDILDPVQVSADGMDPQRLMRFKGQIAFHGGISVQKTLPFGTPEQVREQTGRLIDHLGPLGLIAAPDQHMIGDVPVANIVAMYEAIRQYVLY